MRILVCGGRDFANPVPYLHPKPDENSPEAIHQQLMMDQYRFVHKTLDKIAIERSICYNPDDNWLPSDIQIISGMARGADSAGHDWAICNWCYTHEFPADWKTHGKAAGHIRNQQMIDEGKPDLVVAFPGGKGTADMIQRAKKAGIEVIEVEYND